MIKGTKNLTHGSILRNSITLSWPLLASYFLQVTISLVDLKMVGSLGKEAIAGVGMAQQFVMLSFLIFTAVSVGASIYLAQYTGSEDIEKIRQTVIQTIFLSIIIGLALSFAGLASLKSMIKFMKAEQAVLDEAYNYASMIFIFSPALLLNFTLTSIFRSVGDSKTPLYIMLLINMLNVVLNWLLIYGVWVFPEMGVKGAALATGVSRSVGVIICFVILYRRELLVKVRSLTEILMHPSYAPRFAPMRKIFALGFPSALQDVSWSLAMLLIFKVLAFLENGTDAISAFSIAFNIEALCFMPGIAFMQAATIMVGQHIGAGQIEKAEKAAWINTLGGSSLMAALGLVMALFPDLFSSFFTKEPGVIAIARTYLILMGATQFFIGTKFIIMGSLNGAGDTRLPFWAEVIEHWAFRIPLILLFVMILGHGTTSIWVVMAASNVLNAFFVFFAFRNGYWKRIRLEDSSC